MTLLDPIDIFISYRRTETKAIARLIFEELCERFGRQHVYFDVDRVAAEPDHHWHVSEQVSRCSVVLVIMGDRWAEGPWAFTEDDPVGNEVRAALEMGIPILPILADGAVPPQATDALPFLQSLLCREALPVDSGRDFARHMVAVCRQVERLVREYRAEGSRREDGRSVTATIPSHAPVATATLAPVEKSASGARHKILFGSMGMALAAAVAFSVLHFSSRNGTPSTTQAASPAAAFVAVQPIASAATLSIQASAMPAEARLYLDGEPLPTNPYAGRIRADGMQHAIRAEAPGYVTGNRAFVANREVAVILALARTEGQARGEGKKARPSAAPPPVASVPAEPVAPKTDDCKVSPYYVDSRNIKVVKPECLRILQSP
jgi:hypothetical protein